jgi:hypothetical protein
MIDLYVYYKVRSDRAAQLEPLVRAMQARLASAHGVSAQLKRRPGESDGMQTWMEVYPSVSAGFSDLLAQAELGTVLAGLIDGARHTEVFTDLTACA